MVPFVVPHFFFDPFGRRFRGLSRPRSGPIVVPTQDLVAPMVIPTVVLIVAPHQNSWPRPEICGAYDFR